MKQPMMFHYQELYFETDSSLKFTSKQLLVDFSLSTYLFTNIIIKNEEINIFNQIK